MSIRNIKAIGSLAALALAATLVTGCGNTEEDECVEASSMSFVSKTGGSSGGKGSSGSRSGGSKSGGSKAKTGGSKSGSKAKAPKVHVDDEDCD